MQDICEKALVDKLKEINANVGVAVLMGSGVPEK